MGEGASHGRHRKRKACGTRGFLDKVREIDQLAKVFINMSGSPTPGFVPNDNRREVEKFQFFWNKLAGRGFDAEWA